MPSASPAPPAGLPGVQVITTNQRPPAGRHAGHDGRAPRLRGHRDPRRRARLPRAPERTLPRSTRLPRRAAAPGSRVSAAAASRPASMWTSCSTSWATRLLFPTDFVGRGDMSRGALLLRAARRDVELELPAGRRRRPSRITTEEVSDRWRRPHERNPPFESRPGLTTSTSGREAERRAHQPRQGRSGPRRATPSATCCSTTPTCRPPCCRTSATARW